jgi:hypothetical protein
MTKQKLFLIAALVAGLPAQVLFANFFAFAFTGAGFLVAANTDMGAARLVVFILSTVAACSAGLRALEE